MVTPSDDITLRDILAHMQNMQKALMAQIKQVDDKVDSLAKKVDNLERKVDHMHVSLSTQIENIDKRLDTIEVVELPRIKQAVGLS